MRTGGSGAGKGAVCCWWEPSPLPLQTPRNGSSCQPPGFQEGGGVETARSRPDVLVTRALPQR